MRHGPGLLLCTSIGTLGIVVIGCHQAGVPAARVDAKADSVVGKVQVVGVDPFPQVILVRDGKSKTLTLIGSPALGRLNGLRIAAVGRAADSRLTVARFTVLEANGVPATDGRLIADTAALYLQTSDGVRHRLVSPSPRLRARAGSRVWVSGPLDREPVAYGFIE